MEIVVGTAERLTSELMDRLARYRWKVFVEKLGWNLLTAEGLELDQFDRPDTLYLVARNVSGQVAGAARLLPTTRSYLLQEMFPQLMGSEPLPRSADVWELSRFAAVDFDAPGSQSQFSSPVAVGLLKAALAFAGSQGVRRLITVSPLGIERLLRKAGFVAHRAGPPLIVDGHPLFACWIESEAGELMEAPEPALHS